MLTQVYEFCLALGLPGMFLLAFLAASLLPLGSEWLLLVLLSDSGGVWEDGAAIGVATLGNTLGGLTNYLLAYGGSRLVDGGDLLAKYPRVHHFVQKDGAKISFFAWLPWLGEPVTLVAGFCKVSMVPFILYSGLGRLLRYSACLFLV